MAAPTTIELLDRLSSRLAHVLARPRNGSGHDVHCGFPVPEGEGPAPARLRVEMQYSGLTKAAFADLFGVSTGTVDGWLDGQIAIPAWVVPSLHMYEALAPAAQRRLLRPAAPRAGRNPAKVHPFSRIEEL